MELFDTDDDVTCALSDSFYNFTVNEDDIAGNMVWLKVFSKFSPLL